MSWFAGPGGRELTLSSLRARLPGPADLPRCPVATWVAPFPPPPTEQPAGVTHRSTAPLPSPPPCLPLWTHPSRPSSPGSPSNPALVPLHPDPFWTPWWEVVPQLLLLGMGGPRVWPSGQGHSGSSQERQVRQSSLPTLSQPLRGSQVLTQAQPRLPTCTLGSPHL